jgi:hypothetical protein
MAIYSDFTIDRGSNYSQIVSVTGPNGALLNLTGYSARGKIRKSYASTTSVDFTIAIPNPTLGELVISLSSSTSLTLKAGRYVYDIEIYRSSPSEVVRVLEGQVEITPSVVQGG